MGMSTLMMLYRSDESHAAMVKAAYALDEAGLPLSKELAEYFGCDPGGGIKHVENDPLRLALFDFDGPWPSGPSGDRGFIGAFKYGKDDASAWVDIDVAKLPDTVARIRFEQSW